MSLMTKMNDADAVSMEEKLRSLYLIQSTDCKIDQIRLLRGALPEEVKDLGDEIDALKARIAKLEAEVAETEKFIAARRLEVAGADDNIARYESQREQAKNNREYDSLSKEIEFQGLEKTLAEKRINEGLKAVEQKNAGIAQARETLEGRQIDLDNKQKELVSITEDTAREEEQLLAQRAQYEKVLDSRVLAAYEKVRSNAHNGLAVVTVKRDACGGCFHKIPPQRQIDINQSKKIIVCEYCGRILVSNVFEQEEQ